MGSSLPPKQLDSDLIITGLDSYVQTLKSNKNSPTKTKKSSKKVTTATLKLPTEHKLYLDSD